MENNFYNTVFLSRSNFLKKFNLIPNTLLVDKASFEKCKKELKIAIDIINDDEDNIKNTYMGMRIKFVTDKQEFISVALLED